ncbi:TPA: hypothetical protein CPT88_00585 [Candidatus Gastranaerophilales bacterium HUM_8]|nr:MAG TPA: hypothetical protein CPT88_00585 [Candidatus Gastranaerophilales bacterium HUM_8]DAA99338.1 MAG TPA: hypothetical protein CPT89_10270 [Candidatus Gastranaerophilales bacterium HUM_11]
MGIKADILKEYVSSFDEIKPFNKNTLKYVGIAFQFDNIIDFDNNQTLFYSHVKSLLPYKTERPASEGSLVLTISPVQNQFGFNQQSESYTEYIYTDNKENPTIRVITNKKKIDFQCIDPENNYTSFKDFLEKIWKIFTVFCKAYPEKINLMEVVLRKINKVEIDGNETFLNQNILYESSLFDSFTNTNTYKEFTTVEDSGETVIFRSGIIRNKAESDNNLIIYDFTVKQDNPNELKLESEFLQEMLKQFSTKIFNLYCYCVSKDYIDKVLNKDD